MTGFPPMAGPFAGMSDITGYGLRPRGFDGLMRSLSRLGFPGGAGLGYPMAALGPGAGMGPGFPPGLMQMGWPGLGGLGPVAGLGGLGFGVGGLGGFGGGYGGGFGGAIGGGFGAGFGMPPAGVGAGDPNGAGPG